MFRSFFLILASLGVVSTFNARFAQSPVRANVKAAIDSLVDTQIATDAFSGAIALAKY